MSRLEKLRGDYQKAEQHAQKLMADKDQALQKVRDRYAVKLRQANDKAAAAQKTLNDAEAATVILDRLAAAKKDAADEQAFAAATTVASKTLRSLKLDEAAASLGFTPAEP